MTQNEIQTAVDILIQLIEEGKAMEAFEQFYHEDVIAQENHEAPRVGKDANRVFEEQFLSNVEEVRVYKATSVIVGSGVSAVAWEIDMDHKEWGAVKMTEINLQTWKDGQIIRESYHYNL